MRSILRFLFFLFIPAGISAQSGTNAVPGDNVLRFYRLAIPVTNSAFEEDFNNDYSQVLDFWQECEDFVNEVFVPLGFCFDVIKDRRLQVAPQYDDYSVFELDTEKLNGIIDSDEYDVGMWVTHRPDDSENTGQSVTEGVYARWTKGTGYAKPDSWVVAHEIGHLFGAGHTMPGEGSLMDNEGEFFSFPSILKIRTACMERNSAYYSDIERTNLVGSNDGGNYVYGVKVENNAPSFDAGKMKECYRIPQGSCLAIDAHAVDDDNDKLVYMAAGDDAEFIASLAPQENSMLDYRPVFSADIFYPEYFYAVMGTDIPALEPGRYGLSLLVRDMPHNTGYESMLANPFYCNYAVWNTVVEVVGGEEFKASLLPAKDCYNAGENVTVEWGVNSACFAVGSRVRITMSTDYGATFSHVLAESVPACDGSCEVTLPTVSVGDVEVDFITATRSMPGGIIRVEETGGAAYALTALSPESGGSFNVTGGTVTAVEKVESRNEKEEIYDLRGCKVEKRGKGLYIINGKKVLVK